MTRSSRSYHIFNSSASPIRPSRMSQEEHELLMKIRARPSWEEFPSFPSLRFPVKGTRSGRISHSLPLLRLWFRIACLSTLEQAEFLVNEREGRPDHNMPVYRRELEITAEILQRISNLSTVNLLGVTPIDTPLRDSQVMAVTDPEETNTSVQPILTATGSLKSSFRMVVHTRGLTGYSIEVTRIQAHTSDKTENLHRLLQNDLSMSN